MFYSDDYFKGNLTSAGSIKLSIKNGSKSKTIEIHDRFEPLTTKVTSVLGTVNKVTFGKKDKYVKAYIDSTGYFLFEKISTDPSSSLKRSTTLQFKKGIHYIHVSAYVDGYYPNYSIKLSK